MSYLSHAAFSSVTDTWLSQGIGYYFPLIKHEEKSVVVSSQRKDEMNSVEYKIMLSIVENFIYDSGLQADQTRKTFSRKILKLLVSV